MSVITYTATRRLAPGSVIDVSVTREFRLLTRIRGEKAITQRNTALGGAVESLLFRSDRSFNCATELITPRSQVENQIVEFLASVQNAEVFTFDRRGTVAQPDDPLLCILTSSNFSEIERGKRFHSYRFSLREN